jgi:hypothetical protein
MSRKVLFAVPLIGSLVFAAMRDTAAASSPAVPALAAPFAVLAAPACPLAKLPPPKREQPLTHTMTIYNGPCVTQASFVWQNGQWHSCGNGSPCRGERAACPMRACGNQAPVPGPCR